MKKNYLRNLCSGTKYTIVSLSLVCFVTVSPLRINSQSYTFTPAGATGMNGPTQTQVTNSYTNTNLANSVIVTANAYKTGPYSKAIHTGSPWQEPKEAAAVQTQTWAEKVVKQ